MSLDLTNIFGSGSKKKTDPRVSMAMMLRHLADLMSAEDEEDEFTDPREKEEHEIPVRPRVEPLGGA